MCGRVKCPRTVYVSATDTYVQSKLAPVILHLELIHVFSEIWLPELKELQMILPFAQRRLGLMP